MWDPETGPVSGQCIRACSTVLGTQMGVQEKPRVSMSNNMAKIAEARKTVEQLKLEVNIDRMKVSQAAAELLAFCETHAKDDPLVTPVPAAENPFRDKRLFCVLL
ncbi:guanine nucleotide-binding protein G(I)/G(S)/G(O) subunit gamma-8 isoform X1 [Lagenorhynchus albirostris]|uniref:guanine nucleotide-binding protein G(I)/G(S)/G(O) subunit gamma-8 isoform X1 n=1 Tax=Lagenorhynchus albirostris TaxID=27610 RepID=UPI0028E544FD|nr:guanine nucleotide-binding protein G(I)/G(S)/G(O) subunit gamma-8 isoform X1 [Lagenorhynchus albirostris]